jgi:glycine/D-amino acid oxidase-like deaminating enzyme
MDLDVLIFGGGAAGLWLLAELTEKGHTAVLLESFRLGSGQTIAAQGILHGGLKYTLQGLLTPSAQHVSAMPAIWRECLAGKRHPNLLNTQVRSDFCYLWRTGSIASQLGMIGAKLGLQVTPQSVAKEDRPPVLTGVPGTVARLDEQVISTESFLEDLRAQCLARLLQYEPKSLAFSGVAHAPAVQLRAPGGDELRLRPRTIVLTAGAGNAELRQQLGLDPQVMQRRPLHMVLASGDLPLLYGHCVDGAKTRVTITSAP